MQRHLFPFRAECRWLAALLAAVSRPLLEDLVHELLEARVLVLGLHRRILEKGRVDAAARAQPTHQKLRLPPNPHTHIHICTHMYDMACIGAYSKRDESTPPLGLSLKNESH